MAQEILGKIDKNGLKLALKISHGRWGKTTPKGVSSYWCPWGRGLGSRLGG